MKHIGGHGWDETAEMAVGDIAGETLLAEVFSRIPDERDRALLLAHVGLGISLGSLEEQFSMSSKDLAARCRAILASLREDPALADTLSGVRRAGRADHFQAIVVRLGLQDWFCLYCGAFMVQPVRGRRRKTCSRQHRRKRWEEDKRRSST